MPSPVACTLIVSLSLLAGAITTSSTSSTSSSSSSSSASSVWQRGNSVQVSVFGNFTYSAVLGGGSVQLTDGLVGLRCGGQYKSSRNGGLLPVGPQTQHSVKDPRLGQVDEVSQHYVTAPPLNNITSCEVTATIRYLHEFDAFAFKLSFPKGAHGTLAYPTPKSGAHNESTGLPLPGEWAGDGGGGKEHAGDKGSLEPALPLATHFPSFAVAPELDFMATNGDLIAGNFATDKMSVFAGGLGGGFPHDIQRHRSCNERFEHSAAPCDHAEPDDAPQGSVRVASSRACPRRGADDANRHPYSDWRPGVCWCERVHQFGASQIRARISAEWPGWDRTRVHLVGASDAGKRWLGEAQPRRRRV